MSSIIIDEHPLLEVKDLKKYYPFKQGLFSKETGYVRAVDGLSFSVKRGETLGIVGESGCGKSTAGQMILQLLEPTEGEVWFDQRKLSGLDSNEIRKVRRDLQVIFQDPYASLNPRMKIEDIIAEPLRIHGVSNKDQLRNTVIELMEVVGLSEHQMNRYPHEFSGGQRQRVGIARALALKPKLIVCDEAVSALDVSIQAQILNLLKKLQKEYQLTYIFIAHGLATVKFISERIAVMYLGKIVELAHRDELFSNPKHPYTQSLLSAIPVSHPKEKKERIILQGDLPNPANPPGGCSFHTRCPIAKDICRSQTPQFEINVSGHGVACHFAI
ncbi:ABC transporter ATP-binding protein [Paenibacillus radicis (ex Xue et al. 2023)]|uniref:Dipeptide ABC transporter ATP-binding protein n=1 Tax=Paenibacillus radicis (ex Xue et al. 2023) TaxID=2972489 RepID=A0ABT1YJ82_9BACL|nr:dipeptide ABC transporter ATP-binding protein [Paenibacillus radicis (ex Xue et al. 2023)]MCR8632780.1 dipeptide ABC transporter ATP-binding protein [Paenibacillus radicis (ex Xue et al. 2023)]